MLVSNAVWSFHRSPISSVLLDIHLVSFITCQFLYVCLFQTFFRRMSSFLHKPIAWEAKLKYFFTVKNYNRILYIIQLQMFSPFHVAFFAIIMLFSCHSSLAMDVKDTWEKYVDEKWDLQLYIVTVSRRDTWWISPRQRFPTENDFWVEFCDFFWSKEVIDTKPCLLRYFGVSYKKHLFLTKNQLKLL